MRQEAIELIVALKGHTLPKGTENAYNRLCKAIEQASSVSSIQSDKTSDAEKREWVGLTDEDEIDWDGGDLKSLVKAIEAKLKDKNT